MPHSDPAEQAKAAKEHVRGAFLTAAARGREISKLVEKMEDHARRNHFGEGLEQIWARGRRT